MSIQKPTIASRYLNQKSRALFQKDSYVVVTAFVLCQLTDRIFPRANFAKTAIWEKVRARGMHLCAFLCVCVCMFDLVISSPSGISITSRPSIFAL